MQSRKKTFPLSKSGIDQACKYLESYKEQLLGKTREFLEELAKVGITEADHRFNEANDKESDDKVPTDTSHAYVKNITYDGENVHMDFVVHGEDIVFIEFGAGIHYNNVPAGSSSPNPANDKFGFQIGRYPKGELSLGRFDSWNYQKRKTYGTKATMPVYGASQAMRYEALIGNVARSVFSDWS